MKTFLFIAAFLVSQFESLAQNAVLAEYFLDTDAGFGKNHLITLTNPLPDGTYNLDINLAGLAIGFHKLYIRTKDSEDKWSLTARRNVEVINAPVSVVAGVEYFFNTDPGFGHAARVNFSESLADGSFKFNIPVGSIPAGAHTLYIRAKDSVNSNWSLTQWQRDSVVTSVQSGLWSQPATWSNNKVPDGNTVVLLYHKVNVDILNAVCKSLTPYGNSGQCIVDPGKALKITGHQ